MAASTSALRITGLRKTYGEHEVLRGVDLTVGEGETVVIIGASGSGKTTLLRCINYLERPSGGQIFLKDQPIGRVYHSDGSWAEASERELAKQRQAIGFVFQRFNLFPHLSALDNVAIGLHRVCGVSKSEARERAAARLRDVFLGDHLNKKPYELSGGQQQRVAIARAIVMEPAIILFDEPTSALDPELVREVLDVIRMLASSGMTCVIVTHEMSFARQVAHQVIYVDEGCIVERGTPAVLFGSPREERTRKFLEHFQNAQNGSDHAASPT